MSQTDVRGSASHSRNDSSPRNTIDSARIDEFGQNIQDTAIQEKLNNSRLSQVRSTKGEDHDSDYVAVNDNKTSSAVIIFNIWNSQIGCGTVTLPWAFQQSGVMLGILLTALTCAITFTTQVIILRISGKETDFCMVVKRYYEKTGWVASQIAIIMNYYVGIILFFQVLSQSLYPIILFLSGKEVVVDLEVNWSSFSLAYTCVIVLFVLLILTSPDDLNYVRKVNGFGVVFVCIFLFFVISKGLGSFVNTEHTYSKADYDDYITSQEAGAQLDYLAYIPLFASKFTPVLGILGGGFYCHNMALSIVANAKEPEKNTRNVFIGYVCVFFTYSLVGMLGVYGFTSSEFSSIQPSLNLIAENCLNQFPSDDIAATIIRLCILLQLIAVSTLLFSLLRQQCIILYYGNKYGIEEGAKISPTLPFVANMLVSVAIFAIPFALSVWYPYVGQIGALLAALAVTGTIYILPVICFIKEKGFEHARLEGQTKETLLSSQQREEASHQEEKQEPIELGFFSFWPSTIMGVLITIFGVTVFIIQVFFVVGEIKAGNAETAADAIV